MVAMVTVMSSPSTIRLLRKRSPGLSTWRRSRRREEGWAVTVGIRKHMIMMIIFIMILIFIMMIDVSEKNNHGFDCREACARRCSQRASCNSFSYRCARGICHLCHVHHRQHHNSHWHGFHQTTLSSRTPHKTFDKNTLYQTFLFVLNAGQKKGLNIFLVNNCFSLLWPTYSLAGRCPTIEQVAPAGCWDNETTNTKKYNKHKQTKNNWAKLATNFPSGE